MFRFHEFVRGLAILISLAAILGSMPGNAAADEPLWTIAWITDTQTPDCGRIAALIDKVKADRPSIVLHTGDTRFEWVNECAWKDVMTLLRSRSPAIEFHLAPGNHDLTNGILKAHLRRAATQGVYIADTGQTAPGRGYYHDRVTVDASGPEWPIWNPEVAVHPAWQAEADALPKDGRSRDLPYRYVFQRGGIRFIVCDCYYSDAQRDWIRKLIVEPDGSSATIILQHKHEVDQLARYVEGLEGRHNVRLVLSGDHHNYCFEQRHGVTFVTSAGMAEGRSRDSDAMTLRVYKDRLCLDRYVLPKDREPNAIEGPLKIWECAGTFSEYRRPEWPTPPGRVSPASRPAVRPQPLGPDLIFNGTFDNGIWYERFRGWSPSGWYQWFTCGGHAPEHAVGKDIPHSGKEYVRIHMWAHAWRGGILQNVRGVEPCHWYRLTAYGWFARTADDPQPRERIGIDPCGRLRNQFGVNVTSHPAPPYNECVGDDPRTPQPDWPDIPETTVWSEEHEYYRWGRFEVAAEARSDVITAILYCEPRQRPADKPIYEMNWDTVSMHEIPWPTRRLADEQAVLDVDSGFEHVIVTVQRHLNAVEVTWKTRLPAGASQVLYRLLDSEAVNRQGDRRPARVRISDFPFETPVVYERSAHWHHVSIGDLVVPDAAEKLELVLLSRVLVGDECRTVCSPVQTVSVAAGAGPAGGQR